MSNYTRFKKTLSLIILFTMVFNFLDATEIFAFTDEIESIVNEESTTVIHSKREEKEEVPLIEPLTEGVMALNNTELDITIEKDLDISSAKLEAIAHNGEIYVAVGENGTIKTSNDGLTWHGVESNTSYDLHDVMWNGDIFVTVGTGGTILYSKDGQTWNAASDTQGSKHVVINGGNVIVIYGLSQTLYSITYNNGLFIACGYNGDIWLSKDADKWEPAYSETLLQLEEDNIIGQNCNLTEVASNGKEFIIAGSNAQGNDIILSSTDGEEWYLRYSNKEDSDSYMNSLEIVWDGKQYIVLNKGNYIITSVDGVNWTKKQLKVPSNFYAVDLEFNNNEYVLIGGKWYQDVEYYKSSDLNNWSKMNLNYINNDEYSYEQYDFIRGKEGYISVGSSGVGYKIIGNNINKFNTGQVSNTIEAMAQKGERYVLATGNGLFYGNLKKWTKVDLYGSYTDVKLINDEFYAVGDRRIVKSSDGITYEIIDIDGDLLSITYGNGIFIAVGYYGDILKSTDGVNWIKVDSNTSKTLNKVIHNGEYFIAVGNNANVLKSYDGVTWSKHSFTNKQYNDNDYSDNLEDIIWDGKRFIAVGNHIGISENGEEWQPLNLLTDGVMLKTITQVNNRYIGMGYLGEIATSVDGLNWAYYNKYRWEDVSIVNNYYDGKNLYAFGLDGLFAEVRITENELEIDDGWDYKEEITRFGLNSLDKNEKIAIAVGDYGTIKVSSDGLNWDDVESGTKTKLNKVKYINNKFFVLGDKGTLLSSTDGLKWNKLNSNTESNINDIEYNGKEYVAVGENGLIISSSDGVNWSIITSISGRYINFINIINFKGKFMLFGDEYNSRIFTSVDGKNFDEIEIPYGTSYNIYNVVTNGNRIVIADNGFNLYSDDGVNWNRVDNLGIGKVFYLDNKFVKYCWSLAYYSNDGANWVESEESPFGVPGDVIKFKDKYIAVNNTINGESNIAISDNALNWQEVKIPVTAQEMYDIKWLGGKYIVNGNKNNSLYSFDGVNWIKGLSESASGIFEVAWNGNIYVTGGISGEVYISRYGDNWSSVSIDYLNDSSAWIESVKWINDRFIAISDSGEVVSSYDGYNWSKIADFSYDRVYKTRVVYTNGTYLLFGGTNTAGEGTTEVLISNDGVTWSNKSIPKLFRDITLINNKIIAFGVDGNIYNSIDGYNLSLVTKLIPKNISSSNIIYDGTNLNIITEDKIYTSKDGVNWSNKVFVNNLYGITRGASNGNTIVGIGDMASIISKKISDKVKAARIDILGESFIKKSTKSTKLNYKVKVYDTSGKDISNSSSVKWSVKSEISGVTVDTKGNVTVPANSKPGTIKLTAKLSDDVFATKIITVGNEPSFTLDKDIIKIRVGQTNKINTILPDNVYISDINYSSSNGTIVNVDKSGNIKGLKLGEAIISVSPLFEDFEQEVIVNVVDAEDIDMDGNINIMDVAEIALKYNIGISDKGYNDVLDVNKDKVIDVYDLILVARKIE